jgi:hypothetical protein
MILSNLLGRTGRTIAITTVIVGGLGWVTAPEPAHAISTGEAVGIGVGAAAVGAAIGSSAAPAPAPGYYPTPVYAAPAPVYGQPVPTYAQPAPGYAPGPSGSCWSASEGRYYPC